MKGIKDLKSIKPYSTDDHNLTSVKLDLIKILIVVQILLNILVIIHSIANNLNFYAYLGQFSTISVMVLTAFLIYKKFSITTITLPLCLFYVIAVVPGVRFGLGTDHPLPIMLSAYTGIIIILLLEGWHRISILGLFLIISTVISFIDFQNISEASATPAALGQMISLYMLYSLISVSVWVFKGKFMALNNDIFQSSMTDHLTGASNSLMLDRKLKQKVALFDEFGHNFSAVLIDMDNFKSINDTYGHKQGDRVLCDFVEHANEFIREDDLLARYGGDEFIILFSNCDKQDAQKVVTRLLTETHRIHTITELSFSAGICDYKEAVHLKKDIMKIADERMYHAKGEGKNSVCIT